MDSHLFNIKNNLVHWSSENCWNWLPEKNAFKIKFTALIVCIVKIDCRKMLLQDNEKERVPTNSNYVDVVTCEFRVIHNTLIKCTYVWC